MSKKTIAVVGATGMQGGGLVRAILNDSHSEFVVRALTRNVKSDKAASLAKLGAEVVEADLDNLDSLKNAFRGTYGAFCVTNFWEHHSVEKEMQQAKNMAGAAKEGGLSHVVWSTLEDTRNWIPLSDERMPTLQGKYKVPHFDGKGASDKYFVESGVPSTILLTAFYWDNLLQPGLAPKRGEDGNLVFGLPMGDRKLPGIAAEDIGKCAYGIFKKGKELAGKKVGISGGHLTGSQMAEGMSTVLGEPVKYFPVPFDMFRSFDFPGADDMGNMFQFKHDFEEYYCGARNLDFSRSVNPDLLTFDNWLAKYGKMIPRT